MNNQNWQATNYQKDRLIANTKKYIKQKLDELQRELKCPNEFIYDFTILPSSLSNAVKEVEKFYADQIIDLKEAVDLYDQACYELQGNNNSSEIDVRSWMHHTALAMFVNCMMGDDRAIAATYVAGKKI